MKPDSGRKMSRWGVGPVFVILSVAYSLAVFRLTQACYPMFEIHIIPYRMLVGAGVVLLAVGIPFFIVSVMTVNRAFQAGTLVTTGVFRWCRHPLYASWIVFIVPGTVLLVNSWIGLTAPVFMYVVCRILVRKEEADLTRIFGAEYLEYQKKVPCILPVGGLGKPIR